MKKLDVIIIGGGLSGISAAIECLKQNKKILLLEARDILGGRTSSWHDDGFHVESGLHRILGFYKHFPQLLKTANINYNDVVIWEDEIEFKLSGGLSAIYGLAPIFRFIQTFSSWIGNNHYLNWRDKINFFKFAICGFFRFWFREGDLDQQTILQYAKKHKLSNKVINRLILPLTEGIFFLPPDEYSAKAFFALYSPAVLRWPTIRVGAFRGGMTEILANKLGEYIIKQGGKIQMNSKVNKIIFKDNIIQGISVTGHFIECKNVILATQLSAAKKLIYNSFPAEYFNNILQLPTMPTVTIQLELKSPSMPADHATFSPDTILSSYAEQSRTTFTSKSGRLSIIVGNAKKYINEPSETILNDILKDANKIGLNIAVTNYRVTYQKADFYRMSPGSDYLKPNQKTAITGFAIAGDYTKQKFYTTMEGAVYSGKLAVKALFS